MLETWNGLVFRKNNRHAHANGAYDKFSVNKKVKEEDIHNICKILQSGNYSNHDNVLRTM